MRYEIPKEILNKHNMITFEEYIEIKGESFTKYDFYKMFLENTDYICNKIVEGVATWEDYAKEKVARAFAREQLAPLEEVVEKEVNEETEE